MLSDSEWIDVRPVGLQSPEKWQLQRRPIAKHRRPTQAGLSSFEEQWGLITAGDGIRTHDVQLGK